LIEQVARERRRLAQRTLELQDKERKLARLIGSLIDAGDQGLEGAPIQDFRGVLDWPSRGELIGRFGPRRDPRYKTEVPHNGVDLAVDEGAEIAAIFPGQVLYSAHFEGYGPMVVVHHPGRVFTLYAGLEELRVGKGDMVSLGDILGRCAGKLYFEVRVENQPEDPLTWLR
jgi:septal ring factor EnvC (AmiA/AmiB activator)